MTKAAIVAFTHGLALQLAPDGIRVNAVAPGPVWTPLIPATMDEEKVAHFGEQSPLGRAAQPAEMAPAYVFLVSRLSRRLVHHRRDPQHHRRHPTALSVTAPRCRQPAPWAARRPPRRPHSWLARPAASVQWCSAARRTARAPARRHAGRHCLQEYSQQSSLSSVRPPWHPDPLGASARVPAGACRSGGHRRPGTPGDYQS